MKSSKAILKMAAVLATTAVLSSGAYAGGSWGNGGGWGNGGSNGGSNGGGYDVPEMDAGMAPLALGLVAGVTALVADRRRKKK